MKKIILIGIVLILLIGVIIAASEKEMFIENIKNYIKENYEDNEITGEVIDEEITAEKALEIAVNRLKEDKE